MREAGLWTTRGSVTCKQELWGAYIRVPLVAVNPSFAAGNDAATIWDDLALSVEPVSNLPVVIVVQGVTKSKGSSRLGVCGQWPAVSRDGRLLNTGNGPLITDD